MESLFFVKYLEKMKILNIISNLWHANQNHINISSYLCENG